jgi:hypothetical protein
VKDAMSRDILEELEAAGIGLASSSFEPKACTNEFRFGLNPSRQTRAWTVLRSFRQRSSGASRPSPWSG